MVRLMSAIRILHLYPGEMSIYGDHGNVLALRKRLEWRGYAVEVVQVEVGQKVDIMTADLVFGGGGQDKGQIAVGKDLSGYKADLWNMTKDGVPMLTICGMYQLFGRRFVTSEQLEIPGISIFDAETTGSDQRLIGNVAINTSFGKVVGFENHSGQTTLGSGAQPFGKVVKGGGNNGHDGTEGSRVHNVFGTYLHGSLLPKNPVFADYLISLIVKRKFGEVRLEPLDDAVEIAAYDSAAKRPY